MERVVERNEQLPVGTGQLLLSGGQAGSRQAGDQPEHQCGVFRMESVNQGEGFACVHDTSCSVSEGGEWLVPKHLGSLS